MKTAISIPDDLFVAADALARELGQSRSRLYSQAVREYLARHSADSVTEALDRVCAEIPAADADLARAAARRTFKQVEW